MSAELDAVVAAIAAHRYVWATEDDLQVGVTMVLTAAGIDAQREVTLPGAGRPDLMCGRIVVEVKVLRRGGNGRTDTLDAVERQVARYAAHPDVDAVVVVTTRAQHRELPAEVGGKPVRVVWVSGL